MAIDFKLLPMRFTLVACSSLSFKQGMAGNIIRGALGSIADKQHPLYSRFYGTVATSPFVLRVRHLDGREIAPSVEFEIGINLFLLEGSDYLTETVRRWQLTGLGPTRSEVQLANIGGLEPLRLSLNGPSGSKSLRLQLTFETPTELKTGGLLTETPSFDVFFSRLRDRIGRLSSLYAGEAIARTERLTEIARSIRVVRSDLQHVSVTRHSSRTGQTHPIGGFTGTVEYEGPLAEFLPFLEVGQRTGVGRQTSWGKGEFSVRHILSSS